MRPKLKMNENHGGLPFVGWIFLSSRIPNLSTAKKARKKKQKRLVTACLFREKRDIAFIRAIRKQIFITLYRLAVSRLRIFRAHGQAMV